MPSPPPTLINPSKTTGNNAVAGTEAATCARGCAILAKRGWRPIATPAGIAHAEAMTKAAVTRRKVAPALSIVFTNSMAVTVRSE